MNTATMPVYEWSGLPWHKLEQVVYKLQKRIFKASQRGDTRTLHRLQRLLITSRAAKLLAVRKVTQDNRGKKTAGVDGVKSLTPPQRLQLASTPDRDRQGPAGSSRLDSETRQNGAASTRHSNDAESRRTNPCAAGIGA